MQLSQETYTHARSHTRPAVATITCFSKRRLRSTNSIHSRGRALAIEAAAAAGVPQIYRSAAPVSLSGSGRTELAGRCHVEVTLAHRADPLPAWEKQVNSGLHQTLIVRPVLTKFYYCEF